MRSFEVGKISFRDVIGCVTCKHAFLCEPKPNFGGGNFPPPTRATPSPCPNSSTPTQQSSPPQPFPLEIENLLLTPSKTFSRPTPPLPTGTRPRRMTMTQPSVSILKKSMVCAQSRVLLMLHRFTEYYFRP